MKGNVHKYGDHVDTDVIIPARYLNTADPNELKKHCMEDLDTSFAERVRPGDVLVGGKNFGCGSSREHAAICPMYLGVRLIIARSIERIISANLVNFGILPLLFTDEADLEAIVPGTRIIIEKLSDQLKEGAAITATLALPNGSSRKVTLKHSLSAEDCALILKGGRLRLD